MTNSTNSETVDLAKANQLLTSLNNGHCKNPVEAWEKLEEIASSLLFNNKSQTATAKRFLKKYNEILDSAAVTDNICNLFETEYQNRKPKYQSQNSIVPPTSFAIFYPY